MKVSLVKPPTPAEHAVDWYAVAELARANPGQWVLHPDLENHPHTRSANMTAYRRRNDALRALGGKLETLVRNGVSYQASNNVRRYKGDLWLRWTED
jgi:hypothetical protein